MRISKFLKDKELKFVNGKERIVIYHDPCKLRYLGEYEEPRTILKRTPGVKMREMMHNRERATCCGVSVLCWIPLDCASASNPELGRDSKDKLQIEDLTTVVASRLDLNHKLS